jgi:GTP pyrophosphokinase
MWGAGHPGQQDPETLFAALLAKLKTYLSDADLELVRHAYEFSNEAHRGQLRKSGEPFVIHPLATARILADLHLDVVAISAALLHDVPEDTPVLSSKIEEEFGPEVSKLVDGVTKLSRINWEEFEESKRRISKESKQSEEEVNLWAENLRKMFLAMADDIRVVLIKLADRLHNIATLVYLPPAKRRQVAQETLEISRHWQAASASGK